ncbi:hypothetical protein ACFVAD_05410 [Sutcliffiella sp. NPDC057660]|uniref:hypothetical protein n=1 Tax=Sutcliffiella sp. NPDC057660 TaxID=3346199 RepID=UPI0036A85AA0
MISMSIAALFIPFLILVLLGICLFMAGSYARKTTSDKNRGAGMIRVVYYYLILFMTLMMTIGGSVAAFMAIADIVSPPSYYQSYTEYKEMKIANKTKYDDNGKPISTPEIDEDDLLREYDMVVKQDKERNKERAWNTLIKSFGWIVIPLPIFIFYQRKIRSSKE